ncbi:MAG: A24 family peptidase [Lachnospiraceae bacterium]|nr:A24 family peptidase [Lachnospiraceae bacterium]
MTTKIILFIVFWILLAIIAYRDGKTRRISNGLVLMVAVVAIFSIPFIPEPGLAQRTVGALIVSVPLIVLTLAVPRSFGGGDIKLAAAMGFFLGWEGMLCAFVIAVLSAGVYCAVMLARQRMQIQSVFAFGPFLCLGGAVAACLIFV